MVQISENHDADHFLHQIQMKNEKAQAEAKNEKQFKTERDLMELQHLNLVLD